MERRTNIPKGSAYIDFLKKEDAEQAVAYLNNGQIDGNKITVEKTLPARPIINPRHSPLGVRRPIRRGPSPRRRRSPWYPRGSPRRSPRRRSPLRPRRSPGRRPYRSRSTSSSSSSSRSPVRRGNDRKSPEKRSPLDKKSPNRKRSRSTSPKRRKRSSSSSSSK